MTTYLRFYGKALPKFVDTICILFYTHCSYSLLHNCMCHCIDYKLSALQVKIPEVNALNATTQQFTTVKISGCALKQGVG